MRSVERKLADWHQLHKRLESVRRQLEAAEDDTAQEFLKAEVRRLTGEDDAAIKAVHAAIATIKRTRDASTSP